MSFELKTQKADFIPENLLSFITYLRRHKKNSFVDVGSYLCWQFFRDKKLRQANFEQSHLINAYGPKVILLALATANDHRALTIDADGFYELCCSYLSIPTSISNHTFLDQEAEKIAVELEKLSAKKGYIQNDKIDVTLIRESCLVMFISRGVGIQHRNFGMNLKELFRDYRILQIIDANTSGEASKILESVFGFDTLCVIRSAFGLFSIGNGKDKNGKIDFHSISCDDEITKRLSIDLDTCRLVALKASYKESELRSEWLDKAVLPEEELYQQYVPDPLFTHPIIHRDKTGLGTQFLIPSPGLFLRGFRQTLFKILLLNAERKGLLKENIGKAIENHIEEALLHIFGTKNVQKLNDDGKHADFFVSLKSIDLVVEVKTMIGGFSDKSVQKPDQIATMWNRLYGACTQCSYSIAEHSKVGRKLIAIVLVADHLTAEFLPFQHYASKASLFSEIDIEAIEFISWNELENCFSRTSVNEFERVLTEKWDRSDAMTVGSIMNLEMNADTPAHCYEYLKGVEEEIFGGICA